MIGSVSDPRLEVPVGHYLAHEAGMLAGVSGNKIGQWARRGYIRSSQSSTIPRVYSFQDVAEAMVVHELIDNAVPHLEIRRAIGSLRAESGDDWPLTSAEHLAVTLPGERKGSRKPVAWLLVMKDGRYVRPAKSVGQGVLDIQATKLREDLTRGGWAVRDFPELHHVEVNPERLSGRPTIRGRRIPAEKVAVLAADASGRASLREGYGLTDAEIRDASLWWEKVQEYEKAA
jgi:uncharacterized protein (DUF433 family)/DNA-binding transcriptional MerR regulator